MTVRARKLSGVAALLAAWAIATGHVAAEPRFEIHGSNTVGATLMPALLTAFAHSRNHEIVRVPGENSEEETIYVVSGDGPVFTVDLERYGSGTSAKGLLSGLASIGMSSRPIKDKEAAPLADRFGLDMRDPASEHVVALDGIAIVVSPSNPLTQISQEQIARVFAGDIRDWSELGLAPGPIAVHARDDVSGTYDTFNSLALKPFGVKLRSDAARYASNEKLAKTVAADPLSIGFTPLAFADLAKAVPIALSCGMVIGPDKFSVKAEEYPLGRRLFLYTRGEPKDPIPKALIAFALSDDAQAAVDSVGFVDQSIQLQGADAYLNHLDGAMAGVTNRAEIDELRRYLSITRGARRLSTTLRFSHGGARLDGKAVIDAGRLARWLQLPENAGRTVKLMGFADSVGGYQANLSLSRQRAEAALRALRAQLPDGFDESRVSVDAFSTLAPVACNDTAVGRSANRRVEVWVSR